WWMAPDICLDTAGKAILTAFLGMAGTARGRQSGRIRPPGRPAVRACARPPALLYSTPAPAARRAKRRPRPGDHTPRSPASLPDGARNHGPRVRARSPRHDSDRLLARRAGRRRRGAPFLL